MNACNQNVMLVIRFLDFSLVFTEGHIYNYLHKKPFTNKAVFTSHVLTRTKLTKNRNGNGSCILEKAAVTPSYILM